jgi:acetolactate synthase-1/2/3 large subunit
VGEALAEAWAVATRGAGQTASLILPADTMWSPASASGPWPTPADDPAVDGSRVDAAARALRRPGAALVAGGARLSEAALAGLARIEAGTGCAVHLTRVARIEVGRHVPTFRELPYFPEPLRAALASVEVAVLVGVDEPVTFFGYPDVPSQALPEQAERVVLAGVDDPVEATILALADAVGDDPGTSSARRGAQLPTQPGGPLDPDTLGATVARALPEGAVVINEAVTSGGPFRGYADAAAPHTMLPVLGGAIGGGLPSAVGAAVAAPDRPVLALQADGSAAYTVQSLWTMAREHLDVTVVLLSNRRYQILDVELQRAGMAGLGDVAKGLTDLGRPDLDWVSLAAGFGVPGRRAATATELADALTEALSQPGPHLIEAGLA